MARAKESPRHRRAIIEEEVLTVNLVIQPSTNPLSLQAMVTLEEDELIAASCRALAKSREDEMIADLAALATPATVVPPSNTLTFSLSEGELLSAFADVGPNNPDKLWLLVVLFILNASPVIPDTTRAKALIDLLTVVQKSKMATAINPTATEEPKGTKP
jgi:hypothetical protein